MQEQIQEQEIKLSDYLDAIIKRKWIITSIFLVSVITAAIISLSLPKVYEVSMIIEPSIFGFTNEGEFLYLDSPGNIEAKIKQKAFNLTILNALDLDPEKINIKFDVFQPPESNLIKISMEQAEEKRELGLKLLNALFLELSNSYNRVVDYKKNLVEKEIATASNRIAAERGKIKSEDEKLKILEEREKNLLAEIKEFKSNFERLIDQRDNLLANKSQGKEMSSLLYSNAIQHNIGYFSNLIDEFATVKVAKENTIAGIRNLEREIDDFEIKIEKLTLTKDNLIDNVILLQKPEVSAHPIGPKKRRNVVISGILSLMIGAFLAFFMEFWERSKQK